MSMTSLEMALDLSQHTRSLLQDNWQVGTGATTTVIPVTLRNPSGKAIDITGQVAAELVGATVEFISGVNLGASRNISVATASGTLTLDTALAHAPASGDQFVIMRSLRVEVTAPENIAQVGGIPVPTPGGIASLPITNSPQSIASIANGSAVVADGPLLSADYTIPSNGSIVFCVALASGATSSVLQVSRNASAGTPFWSNLNNGTALAAENEFDANIPVMAGDVINFRLVTASTIGWIEFFFISEQ